MPYVCIWLFTVTTRPYSQSSLHQKPSRLRATTLVVLGIVASARARTLQGYMQMKTREPSLKSVPGERGEREECKYRRLLVLRVKI